MRAFSCRAQRAIAMLLLAAALACAGCAVAPRAPVTLDGLPAGSLEQLTRLIEQAQGRARDQGQRAAQAEVHRTDGCETAVQERLGQRKRAEPDDVDVQIIERGIAACREQRDRDGEWLLVEWLGMVHFISGRYSIAVETQQRLLALANDPHERARAYEAIGRSWLAGGDHAPALQAFRDAFASAGAGAEADPALQAQALRGEGLVHLDRRDYAAALQAFERAIALAREADHRESSGAILSSLAVAQLRAGQTRAAEHSLRAALAVPASLRDELRRAETQMDTLPLPPAMRALLADALPVREWMPHASALLVDGYTCALLQDLLAAQRRAGEALEISEQCRGRALVERLALRALPQEGQAPDIALLRAIAREQQATLVAYTIVLEPAPLPDWLADREVALLILVVGTDGRIDVRRVELASVFDEKFASLAVLVEVSREAIGARGRSIARAEVRQGGDGRPAADWQPRRLYRLLIEPIADLLPRDPDARVIFVPQDSLFLVPFAALPDENGKFLIERHTISTAPSMHTLAFTRRLRNARPLSGEVPRGANALIVGNPAMPSYPQAPGLAPQPLPELPDAEIEAKAIAQLLQAQALTGAQATKAALIARLPQAQLIHLATHGLLDDVSTSRPKMPFARHSALSSLLQPGTAKFRAPGSLALAPDASDSGLLSADEIAQLKTQAQLVVMSACDTGRGAIVGDGVIGLARSWVVAGVPSVIASLWAVPDEPTSELMLAFYRHWQQRPDKAWALRQAMLQIRARHPDPVNWAAFVLIGEAQ